MCRSVYGREEKNLVMAEYNHLHIQPYLPWLPPTTHAFKLPPSIFVSANFKAFKLYAQKLKQKPYSQDFLWKKVIDIWQIDKGKNSSCFCLSHPIEAIELIDEVHMVGRVPTYSPRAHVFVHAYVLLTTTMCYATCKNHQHTSVWCSLHTVCLSRILCTLVYPHHYAWQAP